VSGDAHWPAQMGPYFEFDDHGPSRLPPRNCPNHALAHVQVGNPAVEIVDGCTTDGAGDGSGLQA
jgi:hypothetical protein